MHIDSSSLTVIIYEYLLMRMHPYTSLCVNIRMSMFHVYRVAYTSIICIFDVYTSMYTCEPCSYIYIYMHLVFLRYKSHLC